MVVVSGKKTDQNEWRHIVYKFSFSIWEVGAVRFKSWPHLRARSTDTFLLQSPPASSNSQGFHGRVSLHHTNMSEPSILDGYQSEVKYFAYFLLHSVLFSLWEHLCYQWWTDCCRPPLPSLPALYLASRLCTTDEGVDETNWSLLDAHSSHSEHPCPPLNTVSFVINSHPLISLLPNSCFQIEKFAVWSLICLHVTFWIIGHWGCTLFRQMS